VILIPGARTAEHAADSIAAARLRLTPAEVDRLDAAWAAARPAGRAGR
jgi:aryl-alcohol dehydrogenase-like predicted oxidoreductase